MSFGSSVHEITIQPSMWDPFHLECHRITHTFCWLVGSQDPLLTSSRLCLPPGKSGLLSPDHAHSSFSSPQPQPPNACSPYQQARHLQELTEQHLPPGFTHIAQLRHFLLLWSFHPTIVDRLSLTRPRQRSRLRMRRRRVQRVGRGTYWRRLYPALYAGMPRSSPTMQATRSRTPRGDNNTLYAAYPAHPLGTNAFSRAVPPTYPSSAHSIAPHPRATLTELKPLSS
jgi:hypothetical protein